MLMHIVALTQLVLDPQEMILFQKEFYHPKKKNYVLNKKGKNILKLFDYS